MSLRIAQVAPLYESVPPKLYGGTERVVSYLTEELVEQGHDVTLFASGDSQTAAKLVSPCARSLRLNTAVRDPIIYHTILLDQVSERADEFDVIHFHTDYLHFAAARQWHTPRLTTLHGRLDLPDLPALYKQFGNEPLISISDSQRRPLPEANWHGTVHHGLPSDLYTFRPKASDYLAFVGRISPEKRPDRAIEIAVQSGWKLRIAAKVESVDRPYFESEIKPLLKLPGITFVGEIDEHEKNEFMGNAAALLFPIDWPEPFGLVMIEAMACGTPVIAFNSGSVPEVISHGQTGFICNTVDAAVACVHRISEIDRARCRNEFETRFRAARMARDYVDIYRGLIAMAGTRIRA